MRSIPVSSSRAQTPARRSRIVMTGLAAVAALLVAGCGGGDSGTGAAAGNSAAAADQSVTWNDADVSFAQMMLADHRMVGEMATMAQKKATTAELKAVSKKLNSGQSKAADEISGWLTAWGEPTEAGAAHAQMPGAMTEADMTMLTSMKKGMDFDTMFAQMMVEHHQGAITMAEEEAANGKNPDAKAMAASMVKTLQAQVTSLERIATMES
jgi:uncharacterized protein (DUF305 family)